MYSDQNKDSPRTSQCQSRGCQSHWSEVEGRWLASLGCSTDRVLWPRVDSNWDKRFPPILSSPEGSFPYSTLDQSQSEQSHKIALVCLCLLLLPKLTFTFPRKLKERLKNSQMLHWVTSQTRALPLVLAPTHNLFTFGRDSSIYLSHRSFSVCTHVATYVLVLFAQLAKGHKLCLAGEGATLYKSKSQTYVAPMLDEIWDTDNYFHVLSGVSSYKGTPPQLKWGPMCLSNQ